MTVILRLFNILIALLLIACSSTGHIAPIHERKQPPSQRVQHHTVSSGETLYSIAWRYGIDAKTLATRNSIYSPYTIFPGQKLSLWKNNPAAKARSVTAKATKTNSNYRPTTKSKTAPPSRSKSKPATKSKPVSKKAPRSKTKTQPKSSIKSNTSNKAGLRWSWPAKGRLLARFSGANGLNKGIDIEGKLGEPVNSAAAGRVVYAGNGLRGYGLLLIIKHNDNYLSAYAHNNKLRVKEGDTVKGGQRIADIGSSGANRVKLHFEIRRDGKSVNPLNYLPRR